MVTVGAFLLVILVGEVTLFKVVFMIFFLLFIFAYEVSVIFLYSRYSETWVIVLNYPTWDLFIPKYVQVICPV